MFPQVEAWPEKIDGESLFSDITNVFKKYIDLLEGNAEAITLWTVFTYLHHRFHISPILTINSPVRGCGKTQLLTVLSELVNRPMPTSSTTAASIYHSIDDHHPTLLIDEGDTFIRRNGGVNDLRGILNSGHNRSLAYVHRFNNKQRKVETISTWTPKAIALIGRLPTTVEDRSIIIRMHKRDPETKLERLNLSKLQDECRTLKQKILRWTLDYEHCINTEMINNLGFLSDRAEDNWRPLLEIARVAGNSWLDKATQSARLISNRHMEDEEDIGILLLTDLEKIYRDRNVDKMSSSEIATLLNDIEYRSWSKFSKYQISRILGKYGVSSKNIRYGEKVLRGYQKTDLIPLWKRYIATNKNDVASDTYLLQRNESNIIPYKQIDECSNVATKHIEDLTDDDLKRNMKEYRRKKNVI